MKEIMTREVKTVSQECSLHEAAQKMRSFDVGVLPVCRESRCIGIITDRDITTRATADGCDPRKAQVADYMTNDIITCSPDDDIREVVKLMKHNRVRRIVVVDQTQKPIGICSVGDLALEGSSLQLVGEVMREVARQRW